MEVLSVLRRLMYSFGLLRLLLFGGNSEDVAGYALEMEYGSCWPPSKRWVFTTCTAVRVRPLTLHALSYLSLALLLLCCRDMT